MENSHGIPWWPRGQDSALPPWWPRFNTSSRKEDPASAKAPRQQQQRRAAGIMLSAQSGMLPPAARSPTPPLHTPPLIHAAWGFSWWGRGEKRIQIGKEIKLALSGGDMNIFVEILQEWLGLMWELSRILGQKVTGQKSTVSVLPKARPLCTPLSRCSVSESCPTPCDLTDSSTPGLPVLHYFPEFAWTYVHWVSDAIQPSHPLSSPSPPALNLSQHQGLFQWVGSSHQVAKVLKLQLQRQSFQWTFRVGFL